MDNKSTIVNESVMETQAPEATPQEVLPKEEIKQPAQPGSKTEPTELLKSLQDERLKRKVLEDKMQLIEEELNTFKSSVQSDDVFSDEGKALKTHIDTLKGEISSLREERELDKIYSQFPDLKDLKQDFEEYRVDYPRHKLENVAKLFLSEKGLISTQRKGLEKPTGGDRTPMKMGMSNDEVKNLRLNDPKKYREMLKKDQIKFE